MTNRRDKDGREPWPEAEPAPTAEERAEAEALRQLLEGEPPKGDAPADLELLAETAALLRAGGELADVGAQEARLARVREALLAAPELGGRSSAGERRSGWGALWERLLAIGWPVWVPAGATAVLLVGVALSTVPMMSGEGAPPYGVTEPAPSTALEAPVAIGEPSAPLESPAAIGEPSAPLESPVAIDEPSAPLESPVAIDEPSASLEAPVAIAEPSVPAEAPAGAEVELERSSPWEWLPRPSRELVAAQAQVAGGEAGGLEALRGPMADYRQRLYSVIRARYRQQAQRGVALPERVAAR